MKKIIYKFTCVLAIAAGIVTVGCNKHKDEVAPSTTNNGTLNTNSIDTTMMMHMNDTLRPPSSDGSSKTFFGTDHHIYTANQINANKSLSNNIAFGYFYNPDANFAASITNLGYFPVQYSGWTDANTTFRLVSGTAFSSTTTFTQLKNLYDTGTASNPEGGVYKATAGQIIVYKTSENKYGMIQIVNIVPGMDPVNNYIVVNAKMQQK